MHLRAISNGTTEIDSNGDGLSERARRGASYSQASRSVRPRFAERYARYFGAGIIVTRYRSTYRAVRARRTAVNIQSRGRT